MTTVLTSVSPGEVHTRAEIQPVFGGSVYGGICPADAKANILLYSDEEAGDEFGYKDGWLAEEDEYGKVFEYTAAGKEGHQTFGGRFGGNNSAVLRHAEQGRTLRLFIAVGTVPGTGTKRHRYVGAFKLDKEQPYVVRAARDVTGAMRNVIVFRLRVAGEVAIVEKDMVRPAAETESSLVPSDVTTAKVVEPERNASHKGYRSATPATVAERREALLSDEFEAYLKNQGHKVHRIEIRIKGTTSRLLTDLYDATAHVLYEVKGSNRRELVRMALGQLLDYSRHVKVEKHVGPPRMAGLFPVPPDEDLRDLLSQYGVAVVWPEGGTFVGAPLSHP
jgi:5-methylcytosine-specific restriction protein A